MTDEEYRDALLSCDLYKQACGRGVRENTDIGGRLWLAGTGPATAPVMVVTSVVTPDEAASSVKGGWDRDNDCWRMLPRTPRSFSSPQHNAFKDLALQAGLDLEKCYCTSLVKFLPEETKNRNKPPKWLVDLCLPVLEADIARVKPCIIVCADKAVHDALVKVKGMKFNEADLYGAWLYSKNYNARIYLTKKPSYVEKLDFRERFLFDFGNIARELKAMDGKGVEKLPVNYRVVRHSIELVNLVSMLERENRTVLSVDCEWSGEHHVDGKLRSLQIAWSDTDAAYIRFMDDQMNYAFDVPYKEAGRILGRWCDRQEVKYIGHQLSADLSWMHHVLGMEYYGKGMFDSEFALQACDESSELGLDVLALRYTDFGKYDLDLIVWKKNHGDLVKKYGYGMIPDDIMIPYGVRDVLTVYRAWPRIWEWMGRQDLQKYWNDILGPMVTDVFTYLTLTGIPIDRAKMDEARVLYNWARDEFGKELAKAICEEADTLLATALENAGAGDLTDSIREMVQEGNAAGARHKLITPLRAKGKNASSAMEAYIKACKSKPVQEADKERCKAELASALHELDLDSCLGELLSAVALEQCGAARQTLTDAIDRVVRRTETVFDHYVHAPAFNVQSPVDMRRWLFDVKSYTPLKTTSLKDQGMPAMDWAKIAAKPPAEQAKYTPATDQATLETLASRNRDEVLDKLLQYKKICNICKSFLKEADTGKDGEVVNEQGLHKWLASDDCIHTLQATTETGRPRSFRPNILNLPGYVHARLASAVEGILTLHAEQGQVPPALQKYVGVKGKNLPTIRSMAMARPGWCMPEADLQTAEMRGLAFISGDTKFLDMLMGVDRDFAYIAEEFVPEGVDPVDCVVRTSFPEYIELPEDKEKFLYAMASGGKVKYTFTPDQLARNADGEIKRPRQDMHWNISERAQRKAREAMDKKKDRGAGKVVNFCVAASTMILCESGLKRITDVTLEDRVWDGGNWVRHGGVVSRGRKKVMTYGGLTATPEHVVYTTTGPKPFLVAARNGDTLLASGDGDTPVELDVVPAKPGYGHTLDEDVREAMNTGLYFYPNCDYRDRYDTGTMELEEVYDIVDAGPDNRFTANGVLVHNSSSYGGQAASLQRKIESDTGHQVPIEMVEAMLQAIVDRAPDADKWFKEMEKKPLTSGLIRAASGRLRHCSAFGAEGDYLSDRTRDSVISALGRECRNFA